MKDGEAYLSLAKIYLQRPRGIKAATALLRNAVQLNFGNISDDSREEAASLLRSIMRRGKGLG